MFVQLLLVAVVLISYTDAITCEQKAMDEGRAVSALCFGDLNQGVCVDDGVDYYCNCSYAVFGSDCQDNFICLDPYNPCLNGANCLLIPDVFCFCQLGYSGTYCEIDDNQVITTVTTTTTVVTTVASSPCDVMPCLNNGVCEEIDATTYTCTCLTGFLGTNCEVDICDPNPCQNNGNCTYLNLSYSCDCLLGYIGNECEIPESNCLPNPCLNSGLCQPTETGYICSCVSGYNGTECEYDQRDECSSSPCVNGGFCLDDVEMYLCDCPIYYNGLHCDIFDINFPGGIGEDVAAAPLAADQRNCEIPECALVYGDGVCDAKCNTYNCYWDGRDCSLGTLPWENCTVDSVNCWDVFQDGKCDEECNINTCIHDGFDCDEPVGECKYDNYCSNYYADGLCDNGCNNAPCSWDGLDCDEYPPNYAEGTLVMTILLEPEAIRNNSKMFLREVGQILHTIVVFVQDENGNDKIIAWTEEDEDDVIDSSELSKRSAYNDTVTQETLTGSKVYLKMDNRKCYQSGGSCLQTADEAASLLGARSSKSTIDLEVLPLQNIETEADTTTTENSPSSLLWIMAVLLVIIAFPLVGVLISANRRRKAKGTLWFPDNFVPHTSQGGKRKETSGKESVNLRSIEGTPNGVASVESCDYESHGKSPSTLSGKSHSPDSETDIEPSKKRIKFQEPSPSASSQDDRDQMIMIDDETDKQYWSKSHYDAAEVKVPPLLAMTPPNDVDDADGVQFEVNAQGPGGLTPLMLASAHGCDEDMEERSAAIIVDLLAQGATTSSNTKKTGETSLHLAARYSRSDAAKTLLMSGADANAKDLTGRTPLHAAVAADAMGVFQILLRHNSTNIDSKTYDGTTAMILAARLAVENMVEGLVNAGADLNAADNGGKTALHWAAAVNNGEATSVLLKHGASKDAQDDKEETPLFLASREGSHEAAKILLDYYGNRDITDHMDRSPRDIAEERFHHDIIKLLDEYNIVHVESPPELLSLVANGAVVQSCQQGNYLKNDANKPTKKKMSRTKNGFRFGNSIKQNSGQSKAGMQNFPSSQQQSPPRVLQQFGEDSPAAFSSDNSSMSSPANYPSTSPSSYHSNPASHPNIPVMDNIMVSKNSTINCYDYEDDNHIITAPRISHPFAPSSSSSSPPHYQGEVTMNSSLRLDMGVTAPVTVPNDWIKSIQNNGKGSTTNDCFIDDFLETSIEDVPRFAPSLSQFAAFQALANTPRTTHPGFSNNPCDVQYSSSNVNHMPGSSGGIPATGPSNTHLKLWD
ncbi:uncharacterized protein LOC100378173 [Saccoglossus kowalevskii]|uniref:Neurogenic locus notch homolog protein 1-like n=1 Tax=Saccoglossus kowalevskii TaxID=10224 RepID=A0ABM0MF71_SACKO|nr:PREDICTED: neurogenic locus notch homolog protein 1-like [Saccoglossus kowalevskii]